jgi:hypothetical protein
MKFSLIAALFFISGISYAQNPVLKIDSVDWRAVEIRVFKSKNTPLTLRAMSEWEFDSIHVKRLEDLTTENIELIKKAVAGAGCTIAYIDLKGFYGSPQFPIKGLYVLGLKRRK